jgi:cytochrome c-type biogenesis protein CcmE
MSLLPKSRKARRRLTLVAVIAPVLAVAVGLALWGLGDSVSFFYTPTQAAQARPPAGRSIQLGGLVAKGSVVKQADGAVEFTVEDQHALDRVVFRGDLPDLFREGQGVVALGAFRQDGVFEAKRVLAKHDERYMPKELSKALKAQGEWRGDASRPAYSTPAYPTPSDRTQVSARGGGA